VKTHEFTYGRKSISVAAKENILAGKYAYEITSSQYSQELDDIDGNVKNLT
jgi:hypothetical protein